ncbi:hypothetical protein SDC9_155544 [bioreactor metagenome]|uniref:Uncharacterized protein n=1 Tax=bioreactor metagenome TaxID=1076179 RepID=A0A645F405_9ZZZZ
MTPDMSLNSDSLFSSALIKLMWFIFDGGIPLECLITGLAK